MVRDQQAEATKMAQTTKADTAIIVDDEPYNMIWMKEFLEAKGLRVLTATNVNEGIEIISKEIYRLLVIDLSIPVLPPFEALLGERGGTYAQFPGLFVAEKARNLGYRGKQVVIYSVHNVGEVDQEAKKLGCTYILKGRPKMIKQELEDVLGYDPTDADSVVAALG